MLAVAIVLVGCTDRSSESGVDRAVMTSSAEAAASSVDWSAIPDELLSMDRIDVFRGAAGPHHGVSKLVTEVGVLDLLGSYVINVPPSATFLPNWELSRATDAVSELSAEGSESGSIRREFERRVLIKASNAFGSGPLAKDISGALHDEFAALHDAFFDALEECGRESPWPDVELFLMGDGYAGDYWPQLVTRDFGLSYFEYKELLHACGRYAATYPTLDPAVRDELLAPQRAYFAKVVLEGLRDPLPVVEVPPRYQAEIDDLRRNGW